MAKRNGRNGDNGHNGHDSTELVMDKNLIATNDNFYTYRLKIKCKSESQKKFLMMIENNQITLCNGPAGCGKSYISLAKALQFIQDGTYKKIFIITPVVEVGGSTIGYLPGSYVEKMSPYLFSSYYIIDKIIGKESRIKLVNDKVVEPLALSYLRGVNIDDSILIFEEAQNSTFIEMKTLITRIGTNAKFIISGDLQQIDKFKNIEQSGLYDIMNRLEDMKDIGILNFKESDSVRNPIIKDILKRYV